MRLPIRLLSRALPAATTALTAACVSVLSLTAAHAQVSFTLNPAGVGFLSSANPQTVYFTGTLTNLGTSTVFLNDISIVLDPTTALYATPNDTPFFTTVPDRLTAAGTTGSSYSGAIFGINLVAITDQSLVKNFFGVTTIKGGLTDLSFTTLGTPQQFTAFVAPEPTSAALLVSGLMGAGALSLVRPRRRKR